MQKMIGGNLRLSDKEKHIVSMLAAMVGKECRQNKGQFLAPKTQGAIKGVEGFPCLRDVLVENMPILGRV